MQDKRTTIIENITNTREFKDFVKDYLAWLLDGREGPMPGIDLDSPLFDMIEKATEEVLGEDIWDRDEDAFMESNAELYWDLLEARDTLAGDPEDYLEIAKHISETRPFEKIVREAANKGLSKDTYRALVGLASKAKPVEGVDEEVFVCGLHSVLEDFLVERLEDPRRGPWDYTKPIEKIAETLRFGVFYQKYLDWHIEGMKGPMPRMCDDIYITHMITEATREALGEDIWDLDEDAAMMYETGLYEALDMFLEDIVEQELKTN